MASPFGSIQTHYQQPERLQQKNTMDELKEYKLGELIKDIAAGPFGSNLKVECFVESGFPIIDGANLKGVKVTDNITKYVTEEKARSLHRAIAKRYDVVVTISGNVGQIAYIPNNSKYLEYLVSQRQFRATFDLSKVDVPFLVYYFHTRVGQHKILSFANQVGVPALAQPIKNFKEIILELPPLGKQKQIAGILSSLDDKIDLLNKENATLEAMAETLFRQWFIEDAKEDWEEFPLEYVCERITDGSHYSPESVEVGLPMASVKDMEDWGINLTTCRKISKEEFDKLVSADCLPQVNDILIAKDGSYLKHIFVVNKMQKVVILSSIAIIRPNGLYHPYLLSILLKSDSTKEELKNIVTGAVIPRIVLKDFRKFPILLPPPKKQEQALSFIEPIMKKCFCNREQIQTLIETRDGLLPRVLGKEIKI